MTRQTFTSSRKSVVRRHHDRHMFAPAATAGAAGTPLTQGFTAPAVSATSPRCPATARCPGSRPRSGRRDARHRRRDGPARRPSPGRCRRRRGRSRARSGSPAIAVATVDAMSGGRVELGLGAGWYEREHRGLGIPFPSTSERFDRLEEQLAVVSRPWSTPTGEYFSYRGKHYHLDECSNFPVHAPARADGIAPGAGAPGFPPHRPRPRVIVGGVGRKRTPSLAARFADEFNTGSVTASPSASPTSGASAPTPAGGGTDLGLAHQHHQVSRGGGGDDGPGLSGESRNAQNRRL
jgi:luciferase-like monooxygenase